MGKVLHASKSGYFPFCILNAEDDPSFGGIGPGTTRPLGFELEGIMKLFWVLRTASITSPQGTASGAMIYAKTITGPEFTPTEESEIVCAGFGGGVEIVESFSSASITLRFNIYPYLLYNTLYYPFFVAGAAYDPPGPSPEIESTTSQGGTLVETGTLDVFGYGTIPLYSPSSVRANPFTIAATSWWGYDGTWDTTTGLPL